MKNRYITWHYTTHGVAYLKHILSKFYLEGKIPNGKISFEELDQEKLHQVFDQPIDKGFVFDEIIYLMAPQEVFDAISSRRFSYKKSILEDVLIQKWGLSAIYTEIIDNEAICYELEKEIKYVQDNYSEKLDLFKQSIWRNIQHYPIKEQLIWLKKYSNFKNVYDVEINFIEVTLPITSLRDEKNIADNLSKWIIKYFSRQYFSRNIINISLGSSETQSVWHILSQAEQLPEKTRFVKTYDNKNDDKENRFKSFSILETELNLLISIGSSLDVYPFTNSVPRILVNKKIEVVLESGFSILLIGERGVGKSQIASTAKSKLAALDKTFKGEMIEANCASFANDIMAESELFGYVAGAFTDAKKNNIGLIESAENGILFLDEIHNLSKAVQAKLMKTLQTDGYNRLTIRKLGSNKEEKIKNVRLIFATNKNIEYLRECLLSDFYDRVVQHVIDIPPLRETQEDRVKDWESVWKSLNFKGYSPIPLESDLINWLKKLPLSGNFRDLQKIAMYYNIFSKFDEETREILSEKSAFQYAKKEFEKYHSPIIQVKNEKINFDANKTTKEMIADYCFELQGWAVAKFGGRKKAIDHFREIGDTVTEKTFNDWKNKKAIKK